MKRRNTGSAVRGIVRHIAIGRPEKADEYRYRRWSPENPYQAWRDEQMEKLREMRAYPAGDMKRGVNTVEFFNRHRERYVSRGFRQVDGHGRSFGPRLTLPLTLPDHTRVRPAKVQPEDPWSIASRLNNRAYRLAQRGA